MSDVKEEVVEAVEAVKKKVPWVGYFALAFAVVFFSGLLTSQKGWVTAFDFNTLAGGFGTMKDGAKATFMGQGGAGAREGFLFALSLFPTVILALGVMELIEHLGGLRAAEKLLTPILRPLMGIPGIAGLALITSLQSTDAGAGITRNLSEAGALTEKERGIFVAFQMSAGASITNYLSSGVALFGALTLPMILPLVLMFVMKIIGANIMRFYVLRIEKEEI